jgi:hypothetical protein
VSTKNFFALRLMARHCLRKQKIWGLSAGVVLAALAFIALMPRAGGDTGKHVRVSGTGGSAPIPVTTLVAFHADAQGGDFECLALAPPAQSGPESGQFEVNAMYVTGKVTSVEIRDGAATLRGTATVTGLGAGQNQPFTVSITSGGPGATVKLEVSGLTFAEILVDGHFSIDLGRRD